MPSSPRSTLAPTGRAPRIAGALLLLAAVAGGAGAQVRDSARVTPRRPPPQPTVADTIRPPISPRRAFLYSLVLPGYSQSILDRPLAGALFVGLELTSLAMIRKSAADLRFARRASRDSIPASFEIDPATGRPRIDPETGLPVVDEYLPNRYTPDRVRARRTHLEDWYAVLAFNHLIAAAEAFVSANLWDLPAQVEVRMRPTGAIFGATFRW